MKSGKFLDSEKMTYKHYAELWLREYAKKQMEQTGCEHCVASLNRTIIPALELLKLAKIHPLHIQSLYNKRETERYIQNGKHKPYKASTIKRIHQIINSSLNTAIQCS